MLTEVHARIIDSLYSLYDGKNSFNYYKITPEIKDFLMRFEYKGQPIHKDQIEKYDLFERMVSDGIPSDKARSELLFAKEYTYGGEHYSWNLTDFKFTKKLEY